jgi:hypothetical protein
LTDAGTAPPDTSKVDAGFEAVSAACALRGIVVTRLPSSVTNTLGLELAGTTRTWPIYVDCGEELLRLPSVSISPSTALLSHVSYSGSICIDDGQGLSLDPGRPADIVAHAVLKAYDLLEKSAADAASGHVDFFNELEGYWYTLPDSLRARAYFEVDGVSRRLKGHADRSLKKPTWYFLELDAKVPWEVESEKLESHRVLYVHLDAMSNPPVQPDKLTFAFIEDVLERLSPDQRALWDQLVGPSKNFPKRLALLVSIPRQAGGRSLVGATFTANRGAVDQKAPITPLITRRHTPNYMRERGGASLGLLGKHVVVVGAGAVGSVIVDSLAAAGVGQITVVDHDDYSEDNVFRHILQPLYIDLKKPVAIKLALEQRYPGLRITPVCEAGQQWLKTANLSKYDGIAFALGAPSIERSFARVLKQLKFDLPILFTWLEALDLGGHSVLMRTKGEGCLNCAYRDDEGQTSLASRTGFLEPNQAVTRNLTGCAGAFVPYSALQARRTGLMAAEHILSAVASVADGETSRVPSYRFWVGDGTVAAQHGLRTTPWFQAAHTTSFEDATRQVFGRPCSYCRTPEAPAL